MKKLNFLNIFILIFVSFLFIAGCSNPGVISTSSNNNSTPKNCILTINIDHPSVTDTITEYSAIFEKNGIDPVIVSSTTKIIKKEISSGEWTLIIEAKANTKVILKSKTNLNLPKGKYTFYTSLIPVENLFNLTLNLRKDQNYVNLPSEPGYITKITVTGKKSGSSDIVNEINNFDTPIIFNEIEKGQWQFIAEAKDSNNIVYLKKEFNINLTENTIWTEELPQVKVTPVKFSIDSGIVDNNTQVSLSCSTSSLGGNVTIYYSLNNGTYVAYSTPITISGSANSNITLKAYATKNSLLNSIIITKTYTIADQNTTSQPVITPDSGTYTSDIQVTITHSDSSADIFYTLDGSTPTVSSPKYTGPINITGDGTTMVVKAIAKSPSKTVSSVVTKNYTISYPQLAMPQISPAGGTYQANELFTITAEIGSEIRYTIDGTEPTTSSNLYSTPFTLPVGNRQIKAKAFKNGYKPSNVKTENYIIQEAPFGGIRIYYYSTSTPKIWVWEDNDGRAISQLMGYTWPGPDMNVVSGTSNWWVFEIPESYAPFTKALKMHFNGNSTILYTRDPPQTGWLKNDVWYNSNPDTDVTVSANPTSRSFSDTLTITLNVSNATSSKYTLDGSDPKTSGTSFTNGQQITIGSDMTEGQTKTLKLWATNGTNEVSETYTYTKSSTSLGVTIYYYSTTANPTIWVWEDNGRAISQLMRYTWPGPAMASIGYNWYKFEIPESFAPFTKALKMKFKGSDPEYTRNPPETGWFKNGTWTNTCPDGPFPPSVSANPPGKNFSSNEIIVTLNVSGDNITASKYTLDGTDPKTSPTATSYTNGQTIAIGSGMNINDTKTLKLWATNGTDEANQTYTFKKVEKSNFSWDNATVYFVITDRFLDGDSSNNNFYGRQSDPEHQNIGTFHGGDLKGLTQKLNSNYFTDLGINAIWITAPYEQIHGWVEGANSSFKHYAYHGYYVLDYTKIDANMGTLSDLETFIDTAHSKGIRVVFDIVMNHAGYASIKDLSEFNIGVLKSGWENYSLGNYHTYIDYDSTNWVNWWGPQWVRAGLPGYTQPGGDDYTRCLAYLPDFKTESTDYVNLPVFYTKSGGKSDTNATYIPNFTVRKYITKWLTDWVRNYGVDGFRVDTAKHVEMDAWVYLKNEARQALIDWRNANPSKPGAKWTDDFWTVAEVWGHGVNQSNYHTSGAFDSVINFSYKGSIEGAMGSTSSMDNLFSNYANSINSSSSWNVLSYISSHDTGSVFYNGDDNRQIRAGTVFFLTPGGIQVFYGDELGRENGPCGADPDQGSRSSMNWTKENNAIHQHWKIMGQFRNRHIAIGAGSHTKLKDSPYTFKREKDDDKVVVVIDASGPTTVNVSGIWDNGTVLRDFYTGNTATVSGGNVTFTAGSKGVILIEKP